MRYLVLGGNGMLSHAVFQCLSLNNEVKVTLKGSEEQYQNLKLYNCKNAYYDIDVRKTETLEKIFKDYRPEVVINGVGITHSARETDFIVSLEVNALMPHKISAMCKKWGAKFIQISTDCVFDGCKGEYSENDIPNANNLYGRTKVLGEINKEEHALTIRTSIIGLEIDHYKGLIEWFLSKKGAISGFRRAIFSGITTYELARVIEHILKHQFSLNGILHVASKPISKYDLLIDLQKKIQKDDLVINTDDDFVCNRSLNGERFETICNYKIPSWDNMLTELASKITERNSV